MFDVRVFIFSALSAQNQLSAYGDKPRHYKRSFSEQVGALTGGLSPPENSPAQAMVDAGKSLNLGPIKKGKPNHEKNDFFP